MKLNQETDYAIRMVLLCREYSPQILSGAFIVEKCHAPDRWGKVILTSLTRNKILKSIKGKDGGFQLNKDASKISLLDIVNIFEETAINACVVDKNSCSYRQGLCIVCEKLTEVKGFLDKTLEGLTIEDLVIQQELKFGKNS